MHKPTGRRFPFRKTLTARDDATTSYALRVNRSMMSLSSVSIWNFFKSGQKVTQVKSSPFTGPIFGSLVFVMLSLHTWQNIHSFIEPMWCPFKPSPTTKETTWKTCRTLLGGPLERSAAQVGGHSRWILDSAMTLDRSRNREVWSYTLYTAPYTHTHIYTYIYIY